MSPEVLTKAIEHVPFVKVASLLENLRLLYMIIVYRLCAQLDTLSILSTLANTN